MKNNYLIKVFTLAAAAMIYNSANSQNSFPSTGKVGIGTTTPGANLEISENDAKITLRDKTTNFSYPDFFIQVIDNNLSIKHGYGNIGLTLNNSGYLGIGNTNPTERLVVNGNASVSGILKSGSIDLNSSTFTTGSASNSQIVYLNIGTRSGAQKVASFGTEDGIKFFNTTYFSGNVGIGCSNPTQALCVNGKIQALEIEVKTAPCSDFVFENGYRLKSIYEVEQFVKENKHLPEVPSAKEFAENGYSVGQMDDLLLRKVEELTLYVIELQKQNDALKAEVSKLQK